jgi:hypothetical protein
VHVRQVRVLVRRWSDVARGTLATVSSALLGRDLLLA